MLLADRLVSAEARVALLHRGGAAGADSVVAEVGSETPAAGADAEYEIIPWIADTEEIEIIARSITSAIVNQLLIIERRWIDLEERHTDDLDTDEIMGWHEIMNDA